MSIRCFVLGLLAQQPMSGYGIKRSFECFNWLIDSPSFGSIYPSLRSLREDGQVVVEEAAHRSGPSRKVHTITEAGRHALQEWVNQPVAANASLKTFVMRLMLAENLTHGGLIAHLQQRRSQVAAQLGTLKQLVEAMRQTTGSQQRLVFDYGLALAAAESVWLDSTLEQLSEQPLPVEVVKGNGVGVAV
jgi:DNA-binding PadR family transcriptional regulator